MHNIIISKISSKDVLKDCAEILTRAYNSEPWNDEWTVDKAYQKLACFYECPDFIGFTAFVDGELAGACVGNIEPYYTGDYFYLKEMFVDPKVQKSGVGKALLADLKEHLDTIGIHQMILFTSSEFFPFKFYEKSGFSVMNGMVMMHFDAAN